MYLLRRSQVSTGAAICALPTSIFSHHRRMFSSAITLNTQAQVMLKKDKTKLVEEMNPFIYSHAIKRTVPQDITVGSECLVQDYQGKVIGRGMYNPESLYRVRVLALASEAVESKFDPMSLSIAELILFRLKEAKELRETIVGLPSADTTVYRLVNGEGDRLSGLIIDVFNENTIVVQSSAAWTEKHRSDIEAGVQALYTGTSIMWLPMVTRLAQEGWTETVTQSHTLDLIPNDMQSNSNVSEGNVMRVLENGISYEVSPGNGQKTGFYCDQRENRRFLQKFCKGIIILATHLCNLCHMMNISDMMCVVTICHCVVR
jgi:23S rRNA G2069 N7-methylase RlmK/C1962 C5-methylase RlmI